MKRGLVERERVEAVEQKAGAANRERPRYLEGDAVHAGIDAKRAVAGVGQRAARRPTGQVGALVAHQRLLVGGGGDLTHSIKKDTGDRHPIVAGDGDSQCHVDVELSCSVGDRRHPGAVELYRHAATMVEALVYRQMIGEFGQNDQCRTVGRGLIDQS